MFERTLRRGLLDPFARTRGDELLTELPAWRLLQDNQISLGLGHWRGLLFRRPPRAWKPVHGELRRWFARADSRYLDALREADRLEVALGELLRVRLNGLPHDEPRARATWPEVVGVVCARGFGSTLDGAPPKDAADAGIVGPLAALAGGLR